MVHTSTHKINFVLSHGIKIKITNNENIFLTYVVPLEGSNGHMISNPKNGLDA